MSSQKMTHGSETLASYGYGHDNDDQVNTITNHNGETGEEKVGYEYDANSRLAKIAGTTAYEYDAANNPTKIGSGTYNYNAGDELEKGTGVTYSYNELGERTKTTPEKGPATTYGYDQAGDLTLRRTSRRRRNHRNQGHLRLQRRRTAHIPDDLGHHQLSCVGHDRRTPADSQRRHQQLHLRARRHAGRANQQQPQARSRTCTTTSGLNTAPDRLDRDRDRQMHLQRLRHPDVRRHQLRRRSATTANTPAPTPDSSTSATASTTQPQRNS